MTFFSNPNNGMFPPDYGRSPRPQYRPAQTAQNFSRSPDVFASQQPYFRPMNLNNAWVQDFNAYNMPQPFADPYNSQQQAFNLNVGQQQQPYLTPQYNRRQRQQQQQQPRDIMEGVNSLMGHAGTIKEGLNMMNQFVSLLNSLRL